MGRYVGLLVLLLSALLLVNFTSDVLSAWALVAHGEGDDGPTVAEAAMPNPLPLTGLIQNSDGSLGSGSSARSFGDAERSSLHRHDDIGTTLNSPKGRV